MESERIIEEMAKLDGYTFSDRCLSGEPKWDVDIKRDGFNVSGNTIVKVPLYLTDHNACQRVIDGMDKHILSKYDGILYALTFDYENDTSRISQATCPQKCEAILKAYGKWEE